jgi:hypothetical protein
VLLRNTRGLKSPYFRGLLPEGSRAAYEGPVMGQGITYLVVDGLGHYVFSLPFKILFLRWETASAVPSPLSTS